MPQAESQSHEYRYRAEPLNFSLTLTFVFSQWVFGLIVGILLTLAGGVLGLMLSFVGVPSYASTFLIVGASGVCFPAIMLWASLRFGWYRGYKLRFVREHPLDAQQERLKRYLAPPQPGE